MTINILAEEADPRPATPLRGNSTEPDSILKKNPDPTFKVATDPIPKSTHRKWGSGWMDEYKAFSFLIYFFIRSIFSYLQIGLVSDHCK